MTLAVGPAIRVAKLTELHGIDNQEQSDTWVVLAYVTRVREGFFNNQRVAGVVLLDGDCIWVAESPEFVVSLLG